MRRRRRAISTDDRFVALGLLRLAERMRLSAEDPEPDRSPAAIVRRAVLLLVDAREAGDTELADALEPFIAQQLDRHIAEFREGGHRDVRP